MNIRAKIKETVLEMQNYIRNSIEKNSGARGENVVHSEAQIRIFEDTIRQLNVINLNEQLTDEQILEECKPVFTKSCEQSNLLHQTLNPKQDNPSLVESIMSAVPLQPETIAQQDVDSEKLDQIYEGHRMLNTLTESFHAFQVKPGAPQVNSESSVDTTKLTKQALEALKEADARPEVNKWQPR